MLKNGKSKSHVHTYSPTNYRVPNAMFLSHRRDAALRFTSSAATTATDADIGPPGVVSRVSSVTAGPNSSSASHLLQASSWPAAIAAAAAAANGGSPALELKRSSEFGQSEAWYSTNSLAKRPRYESGSNLPIYPQRPGEKDCAHYMLTRTCKFGDSCKFDHPIWVPDGGIPDWKEISNTVSSETLPERIGEPDCPYFIKTQRCKFGSKCKFNHPRSSENGDISALPERPSEPLCAFYVKTGRCKFGATCKFHHPKDIQILTSDELSYNAEQTQENSVREGATGDTQSFLSPLLHNSKGLPVRMGEVDCPFYMKTGSCKYGATCRYNHPDRNAIYPSVAAFGSSMVTSMAANLSIGSINPSVPIYQAYDPRLSNPMSQLGVAEIMYPQRPGQIECDFYMKTGECKFGERCKFHHPLDRSATSSIKLTPAGLPRREGVSICPYYMKTGTCKFGATCKFDHPPPGEVIEIAKSQGTSATDGGEADS
ncbi:zinc finger CCCH domain-containing protein 37 isoform X2 [Arachis duranensis]|uniref:Zinc finger CCCH domain-containing protein 37 isoform X2 n=1 Tax=Arachis duranensis TaxID=130453 RepID=A0A6P4C2U4_ARADU|nr:zinc finger CCCH domain-containing protein 37 isoform X2 [Arachis duranensis]XP_025615099.1 zinc finger CCCH domain-containing protein 37 isoform X2 [Arachis hypogaea]QHO31945.1 Zinc finger CCCH domain-containing protein [Arachis hypogaea]